MKNVLIYSIIVLLSVGFLVSFLGYLENDSEVLDYKKVDDISRLANDLPGPINRNYSKEIDVDLEVVEVVSEIEKGKEFLYWTYNSTVPGPMIRVREGDLVNINLHSESDSTHENHFHLHSIDLHAAIGDLGGGALTQINHGENVTYSFNASKPGVYVYHCATPPVEDHVSHGMYGLIVVEPEEGFEEVDKEFYLMQGEFYLGRDDVSPVLKNDKELIFYEAPSYVVFNGRVDALTGENVLNVGKEEKVRFFVGNGGISKISSFHLIGEVFDKVYPEAATNIYHENTQTAMVPPGGASIVEFETEKKGDYIFLDHALARFNKGAYGVLNVN